MRSIRTALFTAALLLSLVPSSLAAPPQAVTDALALLDTDYTALAAAQTALATAQAALTAAETADAAIVAAQTDLTLKQKAMQTALDQRDHFGTGGGRGIGTARAADVAALQAAQTALAASQSVLGAALAANPTVVAAQSDVQTKRNAVAAALVKARGDRAALDHALGAAYGAASRGGP